MQNSGLNFHISSYYQLPYISGQSIKEKVIKQSKKIVLFHELVLDLTNFEHPGNNMLLQHYYVSSDFKPQKYPFQGVINGFLNYQHSKTAQLLVGLYTIGKLENYNNKCYQIQNTIKNMNSFGQVNTQLPGKKLYDKIQQDQRNKIHEQAMSKIDFRAPVFDQLQSLNVQQKEVMTQIPKILANPQNVKFKKTAFQEFLYTNNFWVSTVTFQVTVVIAFSYIFSHYKEIYQLGSQNLVSQVTVGFFLFLLGVVKWTALQYYFHRFRLHYSLKELPIIGDHYMHHVFPNKKDKLAMSVYRVAIYMVVFYAFYTQFMSKLRTLCLLTGLLIALTMYDIIHYYCHFGPQTNIKWINYLKRNHLKHHFRDQNRGFGVTNTFWDKVFSTEHINR